MSNERKVKSQEHLVVETTINSLEVLREKYNKRVKTIILKMFQKLQESSSPREKDRIYEDYERKAYEATEEYANKMKEIIEKSLNTIFENGSRD